jgi:hypothetical protein
MFDTEMFLKENLIKGFENGSFTAEQVNIYAFNYYKKGDISEECFNEIKEAVYIGEDASDVQYIQEEEKGIDL